MKLKKALGSVFSLVLIGTAFSITAGEKSPLSQLREAIERVKVELNAAEENKRGEILRSLLTPKIDFEEMAQISLGEFWDEISAAEQKRFVQLFKGLLEKSYSERVEGIREVEIIFLAERVNGNQGEVEAQVRDNGMELLFYLKRSKGSWRVYDIKVDGIRIVHNYKNQFRKILRVNSFAELLVRMERKVNPVVKKAD